MLTPCSTAAVLCILVNFLLALAALRGVDFNDLINEMVSVYNPGFPNEQQAQEKTWLKGIDLWMFRTNAGCCFGSLEMW